MKPTDFIPDTRTVEIGEVGDLTDGDLAQMSADELLRRQVAINIAMKAIRGQLRHADMLRQQRRQRTDMVWLRSAQNAKAMYGNQITLINAEFARRKGGTKTERVAGLHKEFVNVAREKLPEAAFNEWLNEAARRLRASGVRDDDAPARPLTPFQRQLRIESARIASRGDR